jgi:chromate transporter
MVTPALLVIPLLHFLGKRAERPVIRDALSAVVLSSAGLIVYAVLPMAQSTVTGVVPLVLAAASCAILIRKRVNTVWVVLASAAVMLAAAGVGLPMNS